MNLCFVKTGAFSPNVKVCDVKNNVESILKAIDLAVNKGVKILALPELSITGATVGDLFLSDTLLNGAKTGLIEIANYTQGKDLLVFVGLPYAYEGKVYNVYACVSGGEVLGFVPKSVLSSTEVRVFTAWKSENVFIGDIPFGTDIVFADCENNSFKVAVEFSEERNALVPISTYHVINGARIILNPTAVMESSKRITALNESVKAQSKKFSVGYVSINAGNGESTTDGVYSGYAIICENGEVIAKNNPFENQMVVADIDLGAIDYQRRTEPECDYGLTDREYLEVEFSVTTNNQTDRVYDKTPFTVIGEEELMLDIQAQGLRKRIEHTFANKVVVGLSGGLDSTLALIVAVRAVVLAGKTPKDVLAITMPCFGTSSRTLDNSIKLAKAFGVSLKKVDITKSVKRHLKDLNHPEDVHDAAYENAQARERTQVLMDTANMVNGLVVGTGDLSELALGWATYNGDHMSMYSVNGSIPKTLVRHLVNYVANTGKGKFKAVLLDILDTPVSPELLPPSNDKIKQVTEDIVGPYILHDFFLHSMLVRGFTPKKIYAVAKNTFNGEFDNATILKWLKTFVRRFFTQQFKRSCLPDGVKVTEISLSPRGAFNMPSDAVSKLWLEELESIDL